MIDLQGHYDILVTDVDRYQDLVSQVTVANGRFQQQLKEQSELSTVLQSEKDILHEELVELQDERQDLTSKLISFDDEVKELARSREEVSALHNKLVEAQKDRSKLLEEFDGLNWKIQEFGETETELEEVHSKLFQSESLSGALRKKLSDSERDLESERPKYTELSEKCDRLERENAKFVEQAEAVSLEIEKLRSLTAEQLYD